jgi:hypothetical protein
MLKKALLLVVIIVGALGCDSASSPSEDEEQISQDDTTTSADDTQFTAADASVEELVASSALNNSCTPGSPIRWSREGGCCGNGRQRYRKLECVYFPSLGGWAWFAPLEFKCANSCAQ